MSQKALSQNIEVETAIVPATITDSGVSNGFIIDTKGFESLVFTIGSGATTGTVVITPVINESDAFNMAGETLVPSDRLLETLASATFDAAVTADENARKKIGVTNIKRFVTIDLQGSGTGNITLMESTAVLGDPAHINITV